MSKKPVYENVKLPKNWGKIRIDGKLVNPTVKEILTVQSEDNQDYRIKKICPDCKKKYVEEPKPECDHLLGFILYEVAIHMSETKEWAENIKDEWLDKELEPTEKQFKYCPSCSEKIDWEEIEKKIKTTK